MGGRKRGAVLDLLLSTLRPQDECLCHYLLFGLEGIRFSLSGSGSQGPGPEGPAGPHPAVNCLEAILDLLSVGGGRGGGDIVVDDGYIAVANPFQAEQCFELIYRLYASPLTASTVKQVVARRTHENPAGGHFMINYLKFYLEYSRKKVATGRGELDAQTLQLEDIARLNCCAWALKVIALELALHSHVDENENIEQILKVLFEQHAEYAEDMGGAPLPSDTTSNLLFQLMQLVPLSLDFNFDGGDDGDSSETMLIQCMRESSKPFVLNQGEPHQVAGRTVNFNEPPGDFLFVDIPHCILLLKTYFKYAAPSNGAGAGGVLPRRQAGSVSNGVIAGDATKISNMVKVALEYNTYISAMATMSNFCHSFRQVIEMALFKYSTVLLGNYQLLSSDEALDRDLRVVAGQVLEGGVGGRARQVLQTAGKAIHLLATYLLDPCLDLLLRSPRMEMVHAEQLAAAVLAMFDSLHCITLEAGAAQEQGHTASATSPPPLTAARYSDLLSKLVLAILRRGSPGAPRHASSPRYRGKLYVAFFSLLQCGANMVGEESSGGGNEGGIGYSVKEDTRQQCRDLLQKHVVELVSVLGDDIAQGASQQLKAAAGAGNSPEQGGADDSSLVSCASSAFSALSGVLAMLGPSGSGSAEMLDRGGLMQQQQHFSVTGSKRFRDTEFLSPGYLHGLHTLFDRGCLVRVLSSVGLTTTTAAARGVAGGSFKRRKADGNGLNLNTNLHTLEAVLSMCAHLACSSDGTHLLLELGVFGALNSLPALPIPTASHTSTNNHLREGGGKDSFSVDNFNAYLHRKKGSGGGASLSATEAQWLWDENIDVMLSLQLLLFRAALSHLSLPPPALLDQCALFLSRHHNLCAHYLRLQAPTLAGLRITHAIVSLFCLVANGPSPPSTGVSGVSLPSWESRMGAKGDALTTELSKLLTTLGASPLPADMCPPPPPPPSGAGMRSTPSSWWSVVVPSSEAEEGLHRSLVDTPACMRTLAASRSLLSSVSPSSGSSCQWTRFDWEKFQLGLKIMERSASFFRIRCNQWVKLAAAMASSGIAPEAASDFSTFQDKLGLGLLKFDFTVLSFTFRSLGQFYLLLSQEQDKGQQEQHNQAWLKSPFVYGGTGLEGAGRAEGKDEGMGEAGTVVRQQEDHAIRSELLRAVESLLCSVFDMANASVAAAQDVHSHSSLHPELQTTSTTDHDLQMVAELQECMQVSSRFPPHSFVHQVGRMLLANY